MFRRCFEFLWLSSRVPHRVWWPFQPFPFVIAATSTMEPSRQNSVTGMSVPRSCFAYLIRSSMEPPPTRFSMRSGFFFGTPVRRPGCVYVMSRTSSTCAGWTFFHASSTSYSFGIGKTRRSSLSSLGPQTSPTVFRPSIVRRYRHRGYVHRRDFEDRDGDLHLLARGRGRRPIVDDDRVGHAGLVTGKSLDLRTATVRVGPAREMRNGALAALAGRKAHRAVSRSVFLRHWPLLRGKWSLVACDEMRADGTPP